MFIYLLTQPQAEACQKELDLIPKERLEIIHRAMLDHVADNARSLAPTAKGTIARIDKETQKITNKIHNRALKMGKLVLPFFGGDSLYAVRCRPEYCEYHILIKERGVYTIYPPTQPQPNV